MNASLLQFGAPCRLCHRCLSRRGDKLLAQARKAKKDRKEHKQQQLDAAEASAMRFVLDAEDQTLPQAPPPGSRPSRRPDISPGEIYPVFPPKPGSEPASAPWRWDDDDDSDASSSDAAASSSGAAPSDVPRWNPRTGFMRTAAEVQAEQQEAPAAAHGTEEGTPAAAAGPAARTAPAIAASASSSRDQTAQQRLRGRADPPSSSSRAASNLQTPPLNTSASPAAPTASPPPLPPVSRTAVLTSAVGTGVWMAALALFVRNYAALNAAATMGTDPQAVAALLAWPEEGFRSPAEVGVAVAAAAAVTGSRLALKSVWAELREATERSNRQVLTPLGPASILLVALASGLPEELLFRGALLPATFPDWRGVLLAAALFGALHNSGGRNPAFALWAGAVGALYGAAFLATGNVWVPAAAHVTANAASALLWKAGWEPRLALGQGAAGEERTKQRDGE
ncbi:hypothetical protein Agub_g590 [Astrephomene gubernaculifera]|uniref:CAAX prenyl protease 2/Lysostaphin resistance protein A-like domain-containing protein n=1 Tax=Astrephomene gubernaculifera TaxID=47775 RepID=A0AAD3DG01_9CHLO|nr:hypothetical protein Agub_g590 [Astrephomene gubernaculifera]